MGVGAGRAPLGGGAVGLDGAPGRVAAGVAVAACSVATASGRSVTLPSGSWVALASGVAVAGMADATRGSYGYTVFDTDSDISDAAVSALKGVDGVIRVRVLG